MKNIALGKKHKFTKKLISILYSLKVPGIMGTMDACKPQETSFACYNRESEINISWNFTVAGEFLSLHQTNIHSSSPFLK